MKVIDIFKSEKAMFFMAFIILIVMGYGGKFIYSRSILQKGVVVEAVICSVRTGSKGMLIYDYKYIVDCKKYSGISRDPSNDARCNDTIMIVVSAKNYERSQIVRLNKKQEVTLSSEHPRYVIVNNMSSNEKQSLEDRIMADLKKRYKLKEE